MATATQTIVTGVALLLTSPPLNPAPQTVYDYRPMRDPVGDLLPAAWVWISNQRETRHGIGGAAGAGKKWIEHTVQIELRGLSHLENDPQYGQPGFYDLIDAVRARLRANQTLPTATGIVILRAYEDMDVEVAEPATTDGRTMDYQARVTTTATEEITA